MKQKKESKAGLRNFTFLESADKRLIELTDETGKTMTAVIEDLIMGRRQFSPDIERFIESEMDRCRRPRNEIIEACLYTAMKFSGGAMPAEREFVAINSSNDVKNAANAEVALRRGIKAPLAGTARQETLLKPKDDDSPQGSSSKHQSARATRARPPRISQHPIPSEPAVKTHSKKQS